jgi:hypothetical protein
MTSPTRVSLTPTLARQTPHQEFGALLQNTLRQGATLAGSLMGSVPGGGIISAAVSSVTSLASRGGGPGTTSAGLAATGVTTTGGSGGSIVAQLAGSSGEVSSSLGGYLGEMRAEADRSMLMQAQMQQESREYNALSNVLKVRHDSAKAAINNVR